MHGCPAPCREYVLINICGIRCAFLISRGGSWGQSVWVRGRLESHTEIQRKGFPRRMWLLAPRVAPASQAPSLPRWQRKLRWSQGNRPHLHPKHTALSAVFSVLSSPQSRVASWAVNPGGGRLGVKLIPSPPLQPGFLPAPGYDERYSAGRPGAELSSRTAVSLVPGIHCHPPDPGDPAWALLPSPVGSVAWHLRLGSRPSTVTLMARW